MQGECKFGIARAESDSIPTPTDLAFCSGRDENHNPGTITDDVPCHFQSNDVRPTGRRSNLSEAARAECKRDLAS